MDVACCRVSSGGSRGVSGSKPPLRFQKPLEDLMEDALKLKFLEGRATPFFRSRGTSLPGHRG